MRKMFTSLLILVFSIFTGSEAYSLDRTPSPPKILNISPGSTTPAPIVPPITSANAFLSGMDPSNYKIPPGWTLVTTQDFEGGGLGSGQDMSKGNVITTAKPHTGSKSLEGTYFGDDSSVSWILSAGYLTDAKEVYLSFWDHNASGGKTNDEMYIARFYRMSEDGSTFYQEIIIDTFGRRTDVNGGFNSETPTLVIEPQGKLSMGGQTYTYWEVATPVHIDFGSWTQWEVHYKPNTYPTEGAAYSTANRDGFIRIYKNSVLVEDLKNANITGTINMSNMRVQAGGTYTKLTWVKVNFEKPYTLPGDCGSMGNLSDHGPRVTNFANVCPCPNQCPPNGFVPIFKRYIDDVIIMKR